MKKINEVQLATELADAATSQEILNDDKNFPNYRCLDDLVEDDGSGTDIYKPDVQDVFDRWYDYFYNHILETEEFEENVNTVLFDSEYCTIYIDGTNWIRFDKILDTSTVVDSYWKDGVLYKKG